MEKKFKIVTVLLAAVVLVIGAFYAPLAFTYDVYKVKITGKEVKREDHQDTYMLFTDKGVFENTDYVRTFKFNSSDIYGILQINKCYEIGTVGVRIRFLSMYENILKYRKINCSMEGL